METHVNKGVVMLNGVQLGNNLRAARERRGLGQQEAADFLHLPRTAVTNIESGSREVSTLELTRFAHLYRISPGSLLNSSVIEDASVVLMRTFEQANITGEIRRAVEDVRDLFHEGAVLREALGWELDDGFPSYASRISSPAEAIRQGNNVAREERRRLGLGNVPLGNIGALIRSQGIWVSACDLPDDMSGMFLSDKNDGLGILINSKHTAARRRFSYAHEYGHALFDRDGAVRLTQQSNASELIEKRANAFAAAFLMPANGLEDHLRQIDKGRPSRQAQTIYDVANNRQSEVEIRPRPGSQSITYQDVAILARHFGVSYEAAVWRLKSLAHLGPTETKALIEQKNSGKSFTRLLKLRQWDEDEITTEERDQELRSQLAWLGVEAYRREEISAGRLRELAGKLDVAAEELIELAEVARGE
jgi:Zn-dependent peptidase ImmA (M78 family)/transcriptional regulator with XRE-family HTH domain